MKKYQIEVPKAVQEQLDREINYSMHVDHNSVQIRPTELKDLVPQIRFWWYATFAILSVVAFFVYVFTQHIHLIPLSGNNSISTASILLSAVTGTLTFMITFITQKIKKTGPARSFTWRSLIPLVVACAMIIVFIMLALYWLFGQLFQGASFDVYTSAALVFIADAVVNYLMINLAMTLSPGVITNLMTIMIVSGVGFSMLMNSNKNWWKHNFSFLGTTQNSTHLQFNITLIFSGLLLIILVDYLFVSLNRQYNGWGIQSLRVLLYALGACLASIGIFPNNPRFHVLHDRISMWLVYLLLILIVVVRWFLPEVTKQFLRLSYIIGGIMAIDYIVFKTCNYLSLTAFELIAFVLAFAWILLLLQYIENLAKDNVAIFPVTIKFVEQDADPNEHQV